MPQIDIQGLAANPQFRAGAFLFALLLLLGAWKFGLESILE